MEKVKNQSSKKRFCQHQRSWDPQYQKFICAFGDCQCARPLCFYKTKKEIPKEGCDVANNEGKFALAIIGGLAKAGLLPK